MLPNMSGRLAQQPTPNMGDLVTQTSNRRQFLRLALLGSGSALLAACSSSTSTTPAAKSTAAPAAASTQAPAVAAPASSSSGAFNLDQLYSAAKSEGKVVWWDQHESRVAQRFIDAFKAKFPGIEVQYFESSVDELKPKAVAEAR